MTRWSHTVALARAYVNSARRHAGFVAGPFAECGRFPRTTRSAEEDLRLQVPLQRHGLQLAGRLLQRHADDVGATESDHLAPVLLVGGVDGVQAEAGGEHPVVRGGGAAALHVTEHDRARLLAGALLDLLREPLAH